LRKKLIEVALPLEAINQASAREKSIRHGHPSTLHLWWARRPLAACRAVLFGQLVDDPSSWPERFPTEEDQDAERKRLFDLIGGHRNPESGRYERGLVQWESSNDETILNAARYEIARSVAWGQGEEPPDTPGEVLSYLQEHAPPVYDPFCGGGSIPLEAQRLGLRAYGSDLNPVAVLVSKALVEIPPKFAGLPPVNPEAQAELKRGGSWNGKGVQGLAEDVRYYGQWMRDEAEGRIGHLFPQVEVTEEAVRQQPNLKPILGQKLTVIAWLWARTVRSPNPAIGAAMVPLVSSFMLSTKKDKKAWVEPVIDAAAPDGWKFEVQSGSIGTEAEAKAKAGTIGRSTGGHCILTGAPMPFSYVREEGKTTGLGERLMAIVADGPKGRVYLPPAPEHEEIARSAEPEWEPEGDLPDNPRDFKTPNYGLPRFADLFTRRQLVALTTFSNLVAEVREKALTNARAAGLADGERLEDGGTEAEAYADSVATYMSLVVDKGADYWSTICSWHATRELIRNTFGRQAIPMVWDYAECNSLSNSAGNWSSGVEWVVRCLNNGQSFSFAKIDQADAASPKFTEPIVVSTDPPYYDNIGYADLSDFFYVWLRRSLRTVWSEVFRTLLVPKAEELVATPYRHGGRDAAEEFFQIGVGKALKAMADASDERYPLAIYYAFKQSEIETEGVASTGWATFLQGVIAAGLIVDATLPVRSEMSNRMIASGNNALASSIVLVCRKRAETAHAITRADFIRELRDALPPALKLLQQGNIAPVDMAQASIGPGMAVFTQHVQVLEADDSPMNVKTALQIINTELDTFLADQEAEYDEWTRFAISWFETHGVEAGPYGEAEILATARGVSVDGVREAGIIKSGGGKVGLILRPELPSDWNSANDPRLTVWECTQHLIRRLEDQGEGAAAELLAVLGGHADAARALAYRLYGICERKGWAEEGRAYNGLVVVWPDLVDLATSVDTSTVQSELAV
jgi:putative DNA methylase